jgi:hypothetical protein
MLNAVEEAHKGRARGGRENNTPLSDCACTVTWLKGDAKGHSSDVDDGSCGEDGIEVAFLRAVIIAPVSSLSYIVTPVETKGRMMLEGAGGDGSGRAQVAGEGRTKCSDEEFTPKSPQPPPCSPP